MMASIFSLQRAVRLSAKMEEEGGEVGGFSREDRFSVATKEENGRPAQQHQGSS